MSVVITREDLQAYAEVSYIIHHMNQKYIEKVPKKMLDFFDSYKDPTHIIKVDPYVPLQKQGLKRYTLEIIALLHLKYWCEDEVRKQELYDIMLRNQEKLEQQIHDKFSVEKLFDNSSNKTINDEENEEKEDFTKPRIVQRYSNYAQNNDIEDFTDHVEEKKEEQLPIEKKTTDEVSGFFNKLKQKFLSFFKKSEVKKI